jgi:hypothetical protein
MTLKERMLYHQVHPAKLGTDIAAEVTSLYFFWQHELAPALLIWARQAGSGLPFIGHSVFDGVDVHSPGTPFWVPRSWNRNPEPATRSLTVLDTSTSPGLANDATREPM